jgi:hypothetical protein
MTLIFWTQWVHLLYVYPKELWLMFGNSVTFSELTIRSLFYLTYFWYEFTTNLSIPNRPVGLKRGYGIWGGAGYTDNSKRGVLKQLKTFLCLATSYLKNMSSNLLTRSLWQLLFTIIRAHQTNFFFSFSYQNLNWGFWITFECNSKIHFHELNKTCKSLFNWMIGFLLKAEKSKQFSDKKIY